MPISQECRCHFCLVYKLSEQHIWPEDCRSVASEVRSSCLQGHNLLFELRSPDPRAGLKIPEMLSLVHNIYKSITIFDEERHKWWSSSKNSQERAKLVEEMKKEEHREKYERLPASEESMCRKRLRLMRAVNNNTKTTGIDMDTRMGDFCTHVLGIQPGSIIGERVQMYEEEDEQEI